MTAAGHCYVLQTHREPAQICRLAARLRQDSPAATIVIAHDSSNCRLDPAPLAPLRVQLIDALTPVVRGEFSMVDAYLHAVRRIAERGIEYRWLTLLSGQDYPLRAVSAYEQHIDSQPYDGWLQYGDVLGADSPWAPRRRQGKLRYYYRYTRLQRRWLPWVKAGRRLNGIQKLVHFHTTLGPYVGMRSFSHPFDAQFRCYGGSAWHTLSRECVQYLLDVRQRNTGLVEHFRRTMSPEEAFTQTVLVNSGRFRLHRGNLRFIDFTGSIGGSPRTLTRDDLPALMQSGCYFARKFDVQVDAGVLDELDRIAGAVQPPHQRTTAPPSQANNTHSVTDAST